MSAAGVPVLTLWQPWASLCVIIDPATGLPVKTIETRSWSTKYRGPLAIHAALRPPTAFQAVGDWLPYKGMLGEWEMQHYASGEIGAPPDTVVPLGAIIATCTLVDVAPVGEPDSFRTGYVEGDAGDLPGRPVVGVNPEPAGDEDEAAA